MISGLARAWRRRWWQPGPALQGFAGLRPVTVITGGSEGIGFALATQFTRHGSGLLLVARSEARLAEAQGKLVGAEGAPVHFLALDVSRPDAALILDGELARLGAYCDVLVNCAGIGGSGPLAAEDPARVSALVELNVAALTRLTRHFLPGMLVRGEGGVINLASVGSYGPGPNQAAYYASKAYVLSLTEAIAHETAGHGVRICALAPGPVRTRFHARMGAQHAFYRMFSPPIPPALVGWLGYWGYTLGLRVVWPGLATPFAALAMRLLPHRILMPIVATLLKPRR